MLENERERDDFHKRYDAARAEFSLPDEMKPSNDSGYLPLSCAIFWIASDCGKLSSAQTNGDAWRLASKKLFSKIASGDVDVIGVGVDGLPDKISPVLFSAPLIEYPFEEIDLDLMMTWKLCLGINPYFEDSWQGDDWSSDTLRINRKVIWRQIQVLGRQVAKIENLSLHAPVINASVSPAASPNRKRGRRPIKRGAIESMMRKMPIEDLDAMKEEEMAAKFEASRDVCRKARDAVLLESPTNSDN